MRKLLPAAALALLLAACGSQPPAPEQPPSDVRSGQRQDVGSGEVTKVIPPNSDPTYGELNNPNSILARREIFFDYDQYVIKPEFQSIVEAHGKFLVKNANVKMLIQGNADERGSREYNLALGQKRAEAVKKALSLQGAREDQMEAVSLGEEKPRCTDHSEECWAQNRRGDMVYSERK
jgi:peptidoglycan-associated lipoprotein